jgi:hypothetical protein
MANELKAVYGTAVTVINYNSTNISDTHFIAVDTEFDNTSDSTVPYAPWATATMTFDPNVAPTEGKTLDLYMVRKDYDGTSDDTDPPVEAAANANGAQYIGSFVADDSTSTQTRTIVISLEGVIKADFYVKNSLGQALNTSGTAHVLKIRPFTYKPV